VISKNNFMDFANFRQSTPYSFFTNKLTRSLFLGRALRNRVINCWLWILEGYVSERVFAYFWIGLLLKQEQARIKKRSGSNGTPVFHDNEYPSWYFEIKYLKVLRYETEQTAS
jgi:hypothetical protein